ncbi:MAG: hypothetical protein K8I60_09705, partial [Anaerolineae bacterium]|nr:hypothetical protein [Anaerolineae bacterium]
SAPGKLEGLVEEAGLKVLDHGEVDCPFSYPDFETFWRANASAGPLQAAMRAVGLEKLKAALEDAAEAFHTPAGHIKIAPNIFRYITVSP